MTLDLALVTWQPEGIARVAAQNLPRLDGVRYVVSWQQHDNAPVPQALACRDDVTIHRYELPGVANNRNNALDHCCADIVLMADDDMSYSPEGLRKIIKTFETDNDVDVATFRYDGTYRKPYPEASTGLSLPLPCDYWISTVEIAVRRNSEAGKLRFCPEFGPGARFSAAEDEVFMLTALRRGLKCRFFPITIGSHPDVSSGSTAIKSASYLHAIGAYLALCHGMASLSRGFIRAIRLAQHRRTSFIKALAGIYAGIAMTPALKRRNRQTLW